MLIPYYIQRELATKVKAQARPGPITLLTLEAQVRPGPVAARPACGTVRIFATFYIMVYYRGRSRLYFRAT